MELNEKTVAVDTDFINHIADTKMDIEDIITNVKKMLDAFTMIAVVHPLVYENEIDKSNVRLNKMFDQKVVEILKLSDIFTGDATEIQYYTFLVKEFYFSLLGEQLPFSDNEVLTKWIKMRSLGEIHSVSMCLLCGTSVFLSDDKGSKELKRIVEQKNLGEIQVYNRIELREIYINKGDSGISRTNLRKLTHEIIS